MLEWADWHTEGECAVPDPEDAPHGMLWCRNVLPAGVDTKGVAYRLHNWVADSGAGEQVKPTNGRALQNIRDRRNFSKGCTCDVCTGKLKLTKVSYRKWTSNID